MFDNNPCPKIICPSKCVLYTNAAFTDERTLKIDQSTSFSWQTNELHKYFKKWQNNSSQIKFVRLRSNYIFPENCFILT